MKKLLSLILDFFEPPTFNPDFEKIQRIAAPAYLRQAQTIRQPSKSTGDKALPIAVSTDGKGGVSMVFEKEKTVNQTGTVSWDLTNQSPDRGFRSEFVTTTDLKNLASAKLSATTAAKVKPLFAKHKTYTEIAKATGLTVNSAKAYCRVFRLGGVEVEGTTLF